MARRGAARRMKRHVKRDAAKESRGSQKYKKQKGGIIKKAWKGKGGGLQESRGDDTEVRYTSLKFEQLESFSTISL